MIFRIVVLCFLISSIAQAVEPTFDKSWIGIYVSSAEIEGFSGTVLTVEMDYDGKPI